MFNNVKYSHLIPYFLIFTFYSKVILLIEIFILIYEIEGSECWKIVHDKITFKLQ